MNRADLQQLAEDRILDAQGPLGLGRWSGAYYLAGYAVECGLKSCVLAYIIQSGIIFDDKKYAERCWTHDIEELVKLARLEQARGLDIAASPTFGQNWLVATAWSEMSRYQQKTQAEAEDLIHAVNDNTEGVLQWIRKYW